MSKSETRAAHMKHSSVKANGSAVKQLKSINLRVTEDLTVQIMPNQSHEFLMTTKEVAEGYGISQTTLRRHKQEHLDELIEGKHIMSNVQITHGAYHGSSRTTMWTKRGVVRLGFWIKSERSKLFRDWAEDLIIDKLSATPPLFEVPPIAEALPPRRHNRLTPTRLLSIMYDVAKVEDSALRLKITEKLQGGNYGSV